MKTIVDVLNMLYCRYGYVLAGTIINNLSKNRVVIAGGFLRDVFAGDEPKGDLDIFYNKSGIGGIDNISAAAAEKGFSTSFVNMDQYSDIINGLGEKVDPGSKTDIQFIKVSCMLSEIFARFDFTCNCISLDNLGIEQHVSNAIEHCNIKKLVANRASRARFDKFYKMGWTDNGRI